MPLVVQNVTLDEVPEFTRLYCRVFSEQLIDRALYMFSNDPDNEQVNIRNDVEKLRHKRNMHYICVREGQPDADATEPAAKSPILAAAIWRLEDEQTFHEQSKIGDEQPPNSNPDCMARFFGGMAAMRKNVMGSRTHWHLEVLTTDPAHERRGAASLLIRWGTQRADEAGVETFVNASDFGRPLYARHGFEAKQVDEVDLQPYGVDGRHRTTAMLRPARATQPPAATTTVAEPVGSLTSG